MKGTLDQQIEEASEEKAKVEDHRKDVHKKVGQIFRDIEKMQIALERKVQLEFFNQAMEAKADKQMVVNATINKVSKIDIEQILQSKCDKTAHETFIQAIQCRIDEEVATLSAVVSRKANLEDMVYYRKELGGKLERTELDAFRQEFVDRVTHFDQKLVERNQILQQFGEALEQKVDAQMSEVKH